MVVYGAADVCCAAYVELLLVVVCAAGTTLPSGWHHGSSMMHGSMVSMGSMGSMVSTGSMASGSIGPRTEDLRSMDVAPAGPKTVAQLARVTVPPVGGCLWMFAGHTSPGMWGALRATV
jgi:hypothetical protein